jgi:hypothetical protein
MRVATIGIGCSGIEGPFVILSCATVGFAGLGVVAGGGVLEDYGFQHTVQETIPSWKHLFGY